MQSAFAKGMRQCAVGSFGMERYEGLHGSLKATPKCVGIVNVWYNTHSVEINLRIHHSYNVVNDVTPS